MRPEDIPAALVAEIQEVTGLEESTVREIAAFAVAAHRIGFWERLLGAEDPSTLSERVRRLIAPPDTMPLPAWGEAVFRHLDVNAEDRPRAEALLRRLMALVGSDEAAVRAFLKEEDSTLQVPVEEAVRTHGLGVLDQLLRDIAVGGTS